MPRRNSGPRLRFIKRSNTWYITWSEGGRDRQRSTGTANEQQAQIALAAHIGQRHRPKGPVDPAEILVTTALNDYLTERGPDIRAAERVSYAADRLVPFWAGKTLAQVTRASCAAYGKTRGVSNGTLRREFGVLAAAINWQHKTGRVTRSVPVYRPEKPEARDRWLTRPEAARLIWACRAPFRTSYKSSYMALFVVLALYTGRRKEAVLSIRWPQVDLTRGTIDFRRPGERETNKRRGKIAIGRKLLGHLRRARKRGTDLGHVIARPDGQRIGDVKKGFAAAVRRAGLGPDVTPHVLKHTCATWMYLKGVSIEDAAKYLDTSIATLERVYRHSNDDHMRRTAEAI